MKILFAVAPGHGLMLPVVPLVWAARAAGHEVLVATSSEMVEVGAHSGLPMYDVQPDRDVWDELMRAITGDLQLKDADASEEMRLAVKDRNPFGLFLLTMTEGTVAAARAFGADLVVYTSDHVLGALTAIALGVPGLEVGNRVTWSMRDVAFQHDHDPLGGNELVARMRAKLGLPEGPPELIARIDPRAPSMGGIHGDEPDPRDGVPWWPMRFVPYNGGAAVPDWALRRPERPRVCVTLGTVVPTMMGTGSLEVMLAALGELDVEVVLAARPADLASLGAPIPDNVRSVGFLALSAFLPSCSLIVHHGGSGTTAAPLGYGVPQLVLPGFADNSMAAERVADRGVGLSADPATATVSSVRELVDRLLTEPAFAAAAREVSAEMAAQPSPASVVERVAAAMATGTLGGRTRGG
ncbi:salmochelin biosynthesis C-glycosyltransferase IroB [Pseudonocardia eucalypti]|uniref:Salmochelin biosynthesis C-glycosyltransferase IroB n=1 Tax=Pseudonocardia eucalypti TaxID=648755 RepID=A0ABP9PX22_9PSEU|nr:UDP:flavonoid glycosyltransferase YjiC (YdhE family) [Pseudonocardia eucalypti]